MPPQKKTQNKTLTSPIISNLTNPMDSFLLLISQDLSAINIQNRSSFHYFLNTSLSKLINTTHPWLSPSPRYSFFIDVPLPHLYIFHFSEQSPVLSNSLSTTSSYIISCIPLVLISTVNPNYYP